MTTTRTEVEAWASAAATATTEVTSVGSALMQALEAAKLLQVLEDLVPDANDVNGRRSGRLALAIVSALDDDRLVERMALGDWKALEVLYGRYRSPVFWEAYKRLGRDPLLAEEIVQDVLFKAWRSARAYRAERGTAKTWIWQIVRTAIWNKLRSRQSRWAMPEALSLDRLAEEEIPVVLFEDIEDGPFDEAELACRRERVRLAVKELPEHEREEIGLAYWGGLSQSEIADRLGVPLGTVKTRTRSGLQRLARSLADEHRTNALAVA